MAEEKGDGPPNKRQKLEDTDTPPAIAGKYNLCKCSSGRVAVAGPPECPSRLLELI